MAQGDIYTIDVKLMDSAQIVSIVNDSIVLSAIVTFSTGSYDNTTKYGDLSLVSSLGELMHRFFYKENTGTQDWETIELPTMKKLKLNAGDRLRFIADSGSIADRTFLNARITLMEV